MHIPDGFIDGPTSVAGGAVAVAGLAVCLKKASQTMEDRQIPLAGLTAAFVFAVQMLNFPVASGTSGHLLGGVLAAVLVGPWVGTLCVSVVLTVQCLLFADGGVSALGLNIINMAMVGAFGGYAIFLVVKKVLPRTKGGVTVASGIAAGLAPPLAALAFTARVRAGWERRGVGRHGRGSDDRRARAHRHRRGRDHRDGDRLGARRPARSRVGRRRT